MNKKQNSETYVSIPSSVYITELQETIASTKKSWKVFISTIGIDMLFLIILGFIASAYLSSIFLFLQAITTVSMTAQGLQGSSSYASIVFNDITMPLFGMIALLVVLFVVSLYIISVFFLSISTRYAWHIALNEKNTFPSLQELNKTIISCAKIAIPWTILLTVLELISFYGTYMNLARESVGLEETLFSPVHGVILAIVAYVSFVSFHLLISKKSSTSHIILSIKKSILSHFLISWKKAVSFFSTLGFLFMLIIVVGVILQYISVLLLPIHPILTFLFQAIILLGFIVFARTYIFKIYLRVINQ